MSDRQQIIAALKAAEPVRWRWADGNKVAYSPAEYEASINESADAILASTESARVEAERQAFRALVRNYLIELADNEVKLVAGLTALKGATPPTTVATLRPYVVSLGEMVLDHNRGLSRLIQVLIERGIIEGA